jgi:adenine-specific DNA-methyltransferase
MSDGFEENAAYFKLDFLDPGDVTRGEKFESIVPILWMLAGCRGVCEVSKRTGKWFIPKNSPFAVLRDEDAFGEFAPGPEHLARNGGDCHLPRDFQGFCC